jgi:hypothetical protein
MGYVVGSGVGGSSVGAGSDGCAEGGGGGSVVEGGAWVAVASGSPVGGTEVGVMASTVGLGVVSAGTVITMKSAVVVALAVTSTMTGRSVAVALGSSVGWMAGLRRAMGDGASGGEVTTTLGVAAAGVADGDGGVA